MTIGQQIDKMLQVTAKINRIVYGEKATCTITIDDKKNVIVRLYANKYHGKELAYRWKFTRAEVEGYDKLAVSLERMLRDGGAIVDENKEKGGA